MSIQLLTPMLPSLPLVRSAVHPTPALSVPRHLTANPVTDQLVVSRQIARNASMPSTQPLNWSPLLPLNTVGALSQAMNPTQTAVAGEVTLDLLSYNVFGLPKPLGKNITERSTVIGATLGKYDIIGLQETFSRDTKAIGQKLAATGASYSNFKPTAKRVIGSGLEIFSKYPIAETDFQPFRYGSHADALSKKGVAFSRVNVPGIGFVDIYDTHYQAEDDHPKSTFQKAVSKLASLIFPGFDMSYTAIRQHDTQVLADLMRKHEQGYPTFVMGDFNDGDNTSIYATLLQKLGVKDSFREVNPTAPGHSYDGPANPLTESKTQERYDYIFYKPGKNVDVKAVHSELAYNKEGLFMSDHFGVTTRFVLKPKAVAVN